MEYYIVDAFAEAPFGGNPAGVVLLGDWVFPEARLMQLIAAELRYSETVFVRQLAEREFALRYFTLLHEVELCGHATIAAFVLLHRKGLASGACLCHTQAGALRVEAAERVMMQMAAPRIVSTISEVEPLYRAVGLTGYRPALPVQVAYAGLADIMLFQRTPELQSEAHLHITTLQASVDRQQALGISDAHLLIGDGKCVHTRLAVVVFDSQIATLIKQGQGTLHIFRRLIKVRSEHLQIFKR